MLARHQSCIFPSVKRLSAQPCSTAPPLDSAITVDDRRAISDHKERICSVEERWSKDLKPDVYLMRSLSWWFFAKLFKIKAPQTYQTAQDRSHLALCHRGNNSLANKTFPSYLHPPFLFPFLCCSAQLTGGGWGRKWPDFSWYSLSMH